MRNTIFITGGNGFIGRNLIELLIKQNFIVNIDNDSTKFSFKNYRNNNLKNYKISIGNKIKINKLLKKYKPKLIYNLAAETHVDNSISNPKKTIENNILNTFYFFETIRKNLSILPKEFRLIHISTDEVYGSLSKTSKKKFNEKSNIVTNSPYSASKASCDLILSSYVKTFNFPVIITRSCNNFGKYQHFEKIIPKTIKCCVKNNKIPIYDKGQQIREWIYVKDHCKILKKIATQGIIGEVYNIGSSFSLSNIKLVKKIIFYFEKKLNLKNVSNSLIEFVKDRPGHDFKYSVNYSKIKKTLKLSIKNDFDKNLSKTILWYFNNLK